MALLLSFGHKVAAQRGDGAAQMGLDGARRDAEHLRGPADVQVEEQPQRDNLPLPGRQPCQGRHDPRIDGIVGRAFGRAQVRHRAKIGH